MIGARVATMKNGENQYTEGSPIGEPRLTHQSRDAAAAQLNAQTFKLHQLVELQSQPKPATRQRPNFIQRKYFRQFWHCRAKKKSLRAKKRVAGYYAMCNMH